MDSFLHELRNHQVISLTETWLCDNVSNGELSISTSHQIFRCDRVGKRGGGVLLGVDNGFLALRRPDLELGPEILWVEVTFPFNATSSVGRRLLIGTFYRPPSGDITTLEKCFNSVSLARSVGEVMLLGDFNLGIDWSYPVNVKSLSGLEEFFVDHFINGLGLKQCNMFPTRGLAVLDLVLSSLELKVCPAGDYFCSDHGSLEISLEPSGWPPPTPRSTPPPSLRPPTPIWKRTDWAHVNDTLNCLPWCLLEEGSVDEALDMFYDWLAGVLKDCIPHRKPRSRKFPLWMTSETVFVLKNKLSAWRLYKLFPNPNTLKTFMNLRRHANYLTKLDFTNYIASISSECVSNPKRFWSMINSRRNSASTPMEMSFGDVTAVGPGRADLFSKFFSSTFTSNQLLDTSVLDIKCNMVGFATSTNRITSTTAVP
ncbi:uncharacterized protein LOC124155211 [Ischnura elegans]|uniref:uncharacterized protein LOC124155211 n=1 Tax=Ischnura elegans TaxID=197161 RepID=UPI001ED884F0|nr:uncharacterized protein LOC124155211 [Ischnura elegans]